MFEILVDVVAERLERRNVHDFGLVRQRPAARAPHQRVDGDQKSRQRLAGARGRGNQNVAPRADLRPPAQLRLGRLAEARGEPFRDKGIESALL